MAENRVTCPDCGAALRLPPDMSDDESITCPKCQTAFVPDLEAGAAPPRHGAKQRSKSESKTILLVVSMIVGAMLLVGGAVAAVLLLVVRPALKDQPVVIKGPAIDEPVLIPNKQTPPPMPQRPKRQAAKPGEVGVDEGNVAKEIEGEDIDGKKFKLSDYRGKVVLLDFWGNW